MHDLNPATIRSRFPGLKANNWAFFDNAGGSHVLDTVIERITAYLRDTPVQVGASYAPSQQAAARLEEATQAVATLINAQPREIVFGPSASALLARLARALAPQFAPGDEIIITDADHEANITPWLRLAAQGVKVKTWSVNTRNWQLDPDDLRALLSPRTRLVCLTQASNILGQVVDISAITSLVHAHNAQVVVDGVAYVPHRLADMQALDADFYVFSGYKIFGPHIGVLYGKYSALLQLDNLNHAYIERNDIPYKLQPGAFSYELAYGLGAVTQYLQEYGQGNSQGIGQNVDQALHQDHSQGRNALKNAWQRISRYEQNLSTPLLDFLTAKSGVNIIGPREMSPQRLPIISFIAGRHDPAAIVAATDKQKLGLRYGHFHAKRLTDRLGLTQHNGVVRISLAHYNTAAEITRLIQCLDDILT